jgi:hypothetical protein
MKRRLPGLWAAQVAAGLAVAFVILIYLRAWTSPRQPFWPGPYLFVVLPVLCAAPLLANDAVSLRRLCVYTFLILIPVGLHLGPNVLPSWIFLGIAATIGYLRRA